MSFSQNSSFGFGSSGSGGGGGGGTNQKPPLQYIVGVDVGAPLAGTNVWDNPAFQSSYVVLFLNNLLVNLSDVGDGNPFISKPLGDSELTISNYLWNNNDVLVYILITPNP